MDATTHTHGVVGDALNDEEQELKRERIGTVQFVAEQHMPIGSGEEASSPLPLLASDAANLRQP